LKRSDPGASGSTGQRKHPNRTYHTSQQCPSRVRTVQSKPRTEAEEADCRMPDEQPVDGTSRSKRPVDWCSAQRRTQSGALPRAGSRGGAVPPAVGGEGEGGTQHTKHQRPSRARAAWMLQLAVALQWAVGSDGSGERGAGVAWVGNKRGGYPPAQVFVVVGGIANNKHNTPSCWGWARARGRFFTELWSGAAGHSTSSNENNKQRAHNTPHARLVWRLVWTQCTSTSNQQALKHRPTTSHHQAVQTPKQHPPALEQVNPQHTKPPATQPMAKTWACGP
jgi:hypothetical protein